MVSQLKQRADVVLVEQRLATSRTQAQKLIAAAQVEIREGGRWRRLEKSSEKIASSSELRVEAGPEQWYASRGGLKLAGALAEFGVDPQGLVVLDVGQSTGGFTDCLLQQGAARVVGVDVGRDQLAPALRADPRVVCLEGVNARQLPAAQLLEYAPNGFPLAVMDVSFISQTLILPSLAPLLAVGGAMVSLVKPQFEVGRAGIGKGGIVKDASLYTEVEAKLRGACEALHLQVHDYCTSSITGTDGNLEFFIFARKPAV
jgi:23S rRNA (cytidine1920-2'-O)/16S rRNA (cytidine1409-2'-O)-methyltransferase